MPVTNAVNLIWKDQSFATGGWGPNEAFVEPGKGQLGASLSTTHRSFETPCGSYAHFKVMRYLLLSPGCPLRRQSGACALQHHPGRPAGARRRLELLLLRLSPLGVKTYRRDIPGAVYGGTTMPDGRAVQEPCRRSSPTTRSTPTSGVPTAST